jgi:CNP1-like family protein
VRPRRGLCALAALALVASCAQPRDIPDDLDSKPWETQKTLLPSYPKESSLIRFDSGPNRQFAFFVDPASVSIGQGGVVRYTLVARSSSGATNVSYEGIRCPTYQRKAYAFGRSDGTWARAENPRWLPIERDDSQRSALATDFFCLARIRTAQDAVESLARGGYQTPWLR